MPGAAASEATGAEAVCAAGAPTAGNDEATVGWTGGAAAAGTTGGGALTVATRTGGAGARRGGGGMSRRESTVG